MKFIRLLSYLFLVVLFACGADSGITSPALFEEPEKPASTIPVDGPYIFYKPDGTARIISVDENGIYKESLRNTIRQDDVFQVITHDKKHHFGVKLHPIIRQEWKQEAPGKLLVISDPHANFDCFYSVLKANGVINDKYEWTYGNGHLMIIGDIFDRGNDVLPIFWLTYKLDQEARNAGGAVHFLLGNHESMILRGDLRYMKEKYAALSTYVRLDYSKFFGPDTELGRWLAAANSIQIIGNDLFVHAGLAKGFYNRNYAIPYVNEVMSQGLFLNKEGREALSEDSKYLYSSASNTPDGPGILWYRGMVGYEKHEPLDADVLDLILQRYRVNRIIVGHTIFDDITTFYDGKVIAVNVDNQKNFDNKKGRGLLIEPEGTYVIGDNNVQPRILNSK